MIKNAEFWEQIEKVAARAATDEEHRKLYGILDRQKAPGAAYGATYGALTTAGALGGGALAYKLTGNPYFGASMGGLVGSMVGGIAGHQVGKHMTSSDWKNNFKDAAIEMRGKRYPKTPWEVGARADDTSFDKKLVATTTATGAAAGATAAAVTAIDGPVHEPKTMRDLERASKNGVARVHGSPRLTGRAYLKRLMKKGPKYALVGGAAGAALGAISGSLDQAERKSRNKKIDKANE